MTKQETINYLQEELGAAEYHLWALKKGLYKAYGLNDTPKAWEQKIQALETELESLLNPEPKQNLKEDTLELLRKIDVVIAGNAVQVIEPEPEPKPEKIEKVSEITKNVDGIGEVKAVYELNQTPISVNGTIYRQREIIRFTSEKGNASYDLTTQSWLVTPNDMAESKKEKILKVFSSDLDRLGPAPQPDPPKPEIFIRPGKISELSRFPLGELASHEILIAEQENQVIGYVEKNENEIIFIQSLEKGAGKALIQHLQSQYSSLIAVSCLPEAQGFYERMGFHQIESQDKKLPDFLWEKPQLRIVNSDEFKFWKECIEKFLRSFKFNSRLRTSWKAGDTCYKEFNRRYNSLWNLSGYQDKLLSMQNLAAEMFLNRTPDLNLQVLEHGITPAQIEQAKQDIIRLYR